MKLKLFALLFTLCLMTVLHAQHLKPRFGIKAGLNFPAFSIDKLALPITETRKDNGPYAGLFLDIPIHRHFSLQPEAYYIESRVQNYADGDYRGTESPRYVTIPLLAKLNVGHAALYAGPQLNILTYARYTHYVYGDRTETDVTDSSYAKTSFAAAAGVSYIFKYRFGIDLRYQLGLSNARAANGSTALTEVDDQRIKINGAQAGLYFKFGRKVKSKP